MPHIQGVKGEAVLGFVYAQLRFHESFIVLMVYIFDYKTDNNQSK
jgi:hypothetical protein